MKYWNKSSQPSRTVLNNASRYADIGVDRVVNKYGSVLKAPEKEAIKRVPIVIKRIAKSGTALKNAKAIGKVGLVAGQAGGLLYLNGRALETTGNRPIIK